MKVIEFINEFEHRKENGYKIPERIKYNNHFYEYNGSYNNYYQEMSGENVLHFSFEDLDDEIEIIENKKIKKLEYYDNSIMWCLNGREITDNEKDIIDKLNEIIDKINGEQNV